MPHRIHLFSEREFYLAEFRRRTLGFAWPADEPPETEALSAVMAELIANGSRVVLLTSHEAVLDLVPEAQPVGFGDDPFGPRIWAELRKRGLAVLRMPQEGFELACERAVCALRLAKVVWIQSRPPLRRIGGEGRISVVDLAHLEPLLDPASGSGASGDALEVEAGRHAMLGAIRSMIEGGVPSVNVCPPTEVARELFTYAGAGMFFTRDRYAEVRPLGIDDYDLASDLIARGEADGFLVPRTPAAREAVLAHGIGVFIEGRYLAGIGALLPHPAENAAEIASLFALTRYVGEGAGSQIVRYAVERARNEGLGYLFSCTTSDRVEAFFERHGFHRVSQDEVPRVKWEGYDPARRPLVRCLRFDP